MSPLCRRAYVSGFTLLELLVVVGLIGALSLVFLSGWRGGSTSASLQSAQASVGNLISAARTRALASGSDVRILLQVDSDSELANDRFLRHLVLQVASNSDWITISEVTLPDSVGLLPRDPSAFNGLLGTNATWTRPSDNTPLRSTAFRSNTSSFPDAELSAAIGSSVTERWAALKFGGRGTTSSSGALVLGVLRRGGPTTESGTVRFQFSAPEQVRGMSISSYGLPSYVDDLAGF